MSALLFLGSPDGPAVGEIASLVRCLSGFTDALDEEAARHPDLAPDRNIDGEGLAQGHGFEIDLDGGFHGRDPGVVGKARAEDQETVRLVHHPARHRGPAPAKHSRRQRVVVGDQALGLEGRHHRAVQHLGEFHYAGHLETGAVTDDDYRSIGAAEQRLRLFEALLGRRDLARSHASVGSADSGFLAGGHLGHFVWKDDLRNPAVEGGALARQVDEFCVATAGQRDLLPLGDLAVGGHQVDLLEGARTEDLGFHLTGEGDDR